MKVKVKKNSIPKKRSSAKRPKVENKGWRRTRKGSRRS